LNVEYALRTEVWFEVPVPASPITQIRIGFEFPAGGDVTNF
jgi:hypothetical protein